MADLKSELSVDTQLVSCNYEDCLRGTPHPLVPPIFNSSTYMLGSAAEGKELAMNRAANGYLYSRWGNPTVDAAADVIKRLEGAAGTLLFSSGMAACTTALLALLKAGDHMVICNPCYGGVNTFVTETLTSYGIEVSFIQGSATEDYRKAVKGNTKLLYGESPTNPTMTIMDLEAFGKLGKSLPGVVTVMDATFASPYLMQPLKYGIDVSLHSCTKYLAGHTDLVGGAISYSSEEVGKKLHSMQLHLGGVMSPFDAFLLHRSMKTLALRMKKHCENAMAIASYLEKHPKVAYVNYPGLPSHSGHEVAKRVMKDFSGMISFELKGGLEAGIKLVESTKVAVFAVSLGGPESLIEHPASMTHADNIVPREVRIKGGITDGLIRFSVGLENIDDLIKDLDQALAQI